MSNKINLEDLNESDLEIGTREHKKQKVAYIEIYDVETTYTCTFYFNDKEQLQVAIDELQKLLQII